MVLADGRFGYGLSSVYRTRLFTLFTLLARLALTIPVHGPVELSE